jgi:hypothetical protein
MSNNLLSTGFHNDIRLLTVSYREVHQPMGHPSRQPVEMNAATEALCGRVACASLPDFYPVTNAPLIDNFS